MSKSDCIPFDEIASVYDKTRYFPKDTFIKTFEIAIKKIIENYSHLNKIVFFDAGCGTGRITIPFINHFVCYLGNKKIKDKNFNYSQDDIKRIECLKNNCKIYEFYCLDISGPMLYEYKNKLNENKFTIVNDSEYVKIEDDMLFKVFLIEGDLRVFTTDDIRFDIVFAHWIFHTIRDWQIALLNIVKLSHEGSMLITFEEKSDLYNAIDNDFSGIDPIVNPIAIWELYFKYRKSIYNYYGQIPLSAKERIGSHVNDKGIMLWVENLYGGVPDRLLLNDYDEWETTYSYREIVEDIIQQQSFSNMRLANNQIVSKRIYASIAERLSQTLTSDDHDALDTDEFTSKTIFNGYYCILKGKLSAELLLQIIDEVLIKKTPDNLFSIPYRVYAIFMKILWEKLNCNNKSDKEYVEQNNVCGLIGIHFFDDSNDFRGHVKQDFFVRPQSINNQDILNVWENINQSIDTDNSFAFVFDDYEIVENMNMTIFTVTKKDIEHISTSIKNTKKPAIYDYLKLTYEPSKKIYEKAIKNRIIGVSKTDYYQFIVGILELANLCGRTHKDCKYAYIYPSPVVMLSGEPKTFGLILLSKTAIIGEYMAVIEMLNSSIFGSLSSDMKIDLSVNYPVVVTRHDDRSDDKEVEKKLKIKDVNIPPDVLIVTCFAAEFEQAIKLAGVPKNKKESRNIGLPNSYNNEQLSRVYDISHDDFNGKTVWLFQCLETGNSGKHGIYNTLTRLLNYIQLEYQEALPKFVIMGGVAAGLKEESQVRGQILLANDVMRVSIKSGKNFQYESLKDDNYFRHFYSEEIKKSYCLSLLNNNGHKTKYEQQIHTGLFVVVDDVLDDYSKREEIKDKCIKNNYNPVGLDMEGYGFVQACIEKKVKWVICKGISDFAHHKDEVVDFQKNIAKNTFDYIYYCLKNMKND